jgi:uncharacterized protein
LTFIDSNVPMYLVGAAHPHKGDARRLLEELIALRERMVTSVEVFQEILHRFGSIRRLDAVQPAFDALAGIADEILPIEMRDVEEAKAIMQGVMGISARDALHVAVMRRHGIEKILSFDSGFDGMPGISRVC